MFEGAGVVSEGHQGGKQVEEEGGVNQVHLLPYRVWDPIGARCGGGGGVGEGLGDFFFEERSGVGVSPDARPRGEGSFGREKMGQESLVYLHLGVCVGESREVRGFPWGDEPQLLGGQGPPFIAGPSPNPNPV